MVVTGPPDPVTPAQKELKDEMVKRYGERDWDSNYYTHHELVPCLTTALVETQTFDPVKLAAHLETMKWESTVGPMQFGGKKVFGIKRQLISPLTLLQAKGGKAVFVETMLPPEGVLD